MKKTLFVTCFYNGLDNTILGGRTGRYHHYLNSLKTLLNTEADFVVYTSQSEKMILETQIDLSNVKGNVRYIEYDLFSHPYHKYFQSKLNGTKTDRCNEVMHGKSLWMKNHVNEGYDYIYWIDCGLSYGALFPRKYQNGDGYNHYYDCNLFNPKMVEGLNNNEKVVILVATQERHIMDCTPNPNFYRNSPRTISNHVVGGMFGGNTDDVKIFTDKYDDVLYEMTTIDALDREEHLLTLLYDRHRELFNPQFFTTWHHENSDMAKYNGPNEIYFYNIFENLNNKN